MLLRKVDHTHEQMNNSNKVMETPRDNEKEMPETKTIEVELKNTAGRFIRRETMGLRDSIETSHTAQGEIYQGEADKYPEL